MKSQQECHAALCAGKTLIHDYGGKTKYSECGVMIRQTLDGKWAPYTYTFLDFTFWEIYEEPNPSATYDEAVAAKAVRIYGDENVKFPETPYERANPTHEESYWPSSIVALFNLAEARGYRMEVVE